MSVLVLIEEVLGLGRLGLQCEIKAMTPNFIVVEATSPVDTKSIKKTDVWVHAIHRLSKLECLVHTYGTEGTNNRRLPIKAREKGKTLLVTIGKMVFKVEASLQSTRETL